MKIFITGATGQLGRNLTQYLVKEKQHSPQDIVCLVRSPDDAPFLHDMKVTIVQGTLNQISQLKQIFDDYNVNTVFHTAAISDPSVAEDQIFLTNVEGSRNILQAFVESKAHCFVFSSSISVYNTYLKVDGSLIGEEAEMGSLTEGDAYARSKRIIETEIQQLRKLHPEKIFMIARIGPIAGSYDRIIIPKIISIMQKKYLPKLINKGMLEMSIIAPEDVARAMVFLSQNSSTIPEFVYNVTGETVTFKEIFELAADYYGIRPPKFSVPLWFFKILRPVMWLTRVLLPNNKFVKLVFSETALAFFSNNYDYDRSKIESLGFKFLYTPLESIQRGLETIDPEKKMISQ